MTLAYTESNQWSSIHFTAFSSAKRFSIGSNHDTVDMVMMINIERQSIFILSYTCCAKISRQFYIFGMDGLICNHHEYRCIREVGGAPSHCVRSRAGREWSVHVCICRCTCTCAAFYTHAQFALTARYVCTCVCTYTYVTANFAWKLIAINLSEMFCCCLSVPVFLVITAIHSGKNNSGSTLASCIASKVAIRSQEDGVHNLQEEQDSQRVRGTRSQWRGALFPSRARPSELCSWCGTRRASSSPTAVRTTTRAV